MKKIVLCVVSLLLAWQVFAGTEKRDDDALFRPAVLMADALLISADCFPIRYRSEELDMVVLSTPGARERRYIIDWEQQELTITIAPFGEKLIEGGKDNPHNVVLMDFGLDGTLDTGADPVDKSNNLQLLYQHELIFFRHAINSCQNSLKGEFSFLYSRRGVC